MCLRLGERSTQALGLRLHALLLQLLLLLLLGTVSSKLGLKPLDVSDGPAHHYGVFQARRC